MEEQRNHRKLSPLLWFKGLSPWICGVFLNVAVMLLLVLIFFMAGSYTYGPAKTARGYYEARLAEDWNAVYDNCKFPDSRFLSRQIFVNAMSYQEEETSAEMQTPEITSYMMRKKENSGNRATYQVNYSLKDDGDAHIESIALEKGSSVLKVFNNWYVLPENLYIKDVSVTVPEGARLTIDGIDVLKELKKDSEVSNRATYNIPYLFCGYHTIELEETGKDTYRKIFKLEEKKALEFIPDLQLNNKSGKEICEQTEKAIDGIYTAAAAQKDFKEISAFFSSDAKTQKSARKAYEELVSEFSTRKTTGISTLSVTRVITSVQNREDVMRVEIELSYTAERVRKRFFFFYNTENYSDSTKLKAQVTKEGDYWVFDEGIIP